MPEHDHKTQLPEPRIPKPSEIMRTRRPELFSDTPPLKVPVLEKSYFEYYLSTLTNRKQEQIFEMFCHRLAEIELCSNLKPQTGPTGGGDSKVDSSTYPVAPALAERCFWSTPEPPSDEAWAFAFSCKKKWSDKVKQDTEKIANLDRKFTKVFFISNQFIRDKIRAEKESALSKKHGFELHILDRSWIMQVVFNHKHEDIAIETLGLITLESKKPQLGVRDTLRQQKFDALQKNLSQPGIYFGNDYALAQDYLTAAKLARGLEKPRYEVDSLFTRARTLAQKFGYVSQIIRCGYNHAWTSYCWFDDPDALQGIYSEIEGYLPTISDAEDCELIFNLWLLLHGAVTSGTISSKKARLEERLSHVRIQLERLAGEKEHPNNALYAETSLYFLDLIDGIMSSTKVEHVFENLRKCLKNSEGLITYPIMKFINRLSEMDSLIGHLPGFESLFIIMREIVKNRHGETSEGELLYRHGIQLIERDELQDALRCLCQAQIKLAKRETLQTSIRAAIGCSDAYMGMGLYWAARMEALTAAYNALKSIGTDNEFPIESTIASMNMGWLELHLGRIAPFLAWYENSWLLLGQLLSRDYNVEHLMESLRLQEGVFGCLLLNMDSEEVKQLAGLQQNLDKVNLPMVRWALLYSLDEIDILVKVVPEFIAANRNELDEFFSRWRTQPASGQLPKDLTGDTSQYQKFETTIMNVSYCIKARNIFGCILFAENLLGIIEAALALAKWENLAFIVDEVNIVVDVDASGDNPPPLNLGMPPDPKGYSLVWKPDILEWMRKTDRTKVHDYLMKFLFKLLLDITIDPMDDLTQELDKWNEEDTFNLAIGMSPTSIALIDLIGKERYELRYWCKPTSSPQV